LGTEVKKPLGKQDRSAKKNAQKNEKNSKKKTKILQFK